MHSLTIDIYSDVVCPWCFIGARRLRTVLEELAGEVRAEVRHHPFMLNPGAPAGGVDLRAQLAERYGADPTPMFARVEAVAREAGIPLDLSLQRYTYDTTAAHTLLRHAAAKRTQAGLADDLFAAYFLDARDVSDPSVLADVAGKHGFTRDEVRHLVGDPAEAALTRLEAADAARNGVRGVPLFILNGRLPLSGAQSADAFRQAIRRAIAETPRAGAA